MLNWISIADFTKPFSECTKHVFPSKGEKIFFGTITIRSPLTYSVCDKEVRSRVQKLFFERSFSFSISISHCSCNCRVAYTWNFRWLLRKGWSTSGKCPMTMRHEYFSGRQVENFFVKTDEGKCNFKKACHALDARRVTSTLSAPILPWCLSLVATSVRRCRSIQLNGPGNPGMLSRVCMYITGVDMNVGRTSKFFR